MSAVLYPRGKPRLLLDMAVSGEINLTVSKPILDEMAGVLARKFKATPKDIDEAIVVVTTAARTLRPAVTLDVIKTDPSDNRILECAVSGCSDYIVTGDKDLLRIRSYDAIQIVTVSEFLHVRQSLIGL